MRPTTRRFQRPLSRSLVALASLSLLVLSLGPVSALGANTRDIFFGSPGAANGVLTFSPVTVGGNSVVKLRISNGGNQPVNFVKWAAGLYADGLAYNPSYPAPAPPSLGGSTIALLAPSAGCAPVPTANTPTNTLLCDIGTLVPGPSGLTYTVVLTPPATAGTYHVWFTASWNEGWSTSGSNADYQFAQGDIVVETADCDTPAASYFLPGQAVSLNVGDGTNCQSASLSSQALGGIGGFGSLGIDNGFLAGCPAGYSCFGDTVSAAVGGGVAVPGGVRWDLTWYLIKSLKGVIHFHDDYDATTNPNAYDAIPFSKKYLCSAQLTTNCWEYTESSKGNADPLWFRAIFITPNNGKAGGFI